MRFTSKIRIMLVACRLSEPGFSIIEMMVVLGMVFVSILAMIQMTLNMSRSGNSTQFRSNADTLNEEIRALLSSEVACSNSFLGLRADATTNLNIANIKDGTTPPGVASYTAGSAYGDRSLKISSITLSGFIAGPSIDKAQLTLVTTFAPNKDASGPQLVSRNINISVGRDVTNNITNCIALAKMSDGIWQRSALNLANIFFNGPVTGGNVGIGTTTPEAKLHLSDTDKSVWLRVVNMNSTAARWPGVYVENFGGNAPGSSVIAFKSSRGSSAAPASLQTGDRLAIVAAQGQYGAAASSFYQSAQMQFVANSDFSATSAGTNITFHTLADGQTGPIGGPERVRISHNGNVGIGTIAPINLLSVNQATDTTAAVTATYGLTIMDQGLHRITLGGDANYAYLQSWNSKPLQINNQGNDTIINASLGKVGIGNIAPVKLLHVGSASIGSGLAVANFQNVDGTCTITPASSGSGIACSSDERLKENFQDVTGAFALDRILQLQAVTYNFKTSSTDNRRTGYKAQEVQKLAPEFVRENEDGLLQVYYDAFIPWITEAFKLLYSRIIGVEGRQLAQDQEIDAQARQIASKANKEALNAANSKIQKLEAENAAIKTYLCAIDPQATICK